MSYSEFLSKAIKEVGYSQNQICMQAKSKYNVDIDPSYISKLQSGKKIASNEINEALAKVCKVDPEDLQFEADFERAPQSVQKSIYEMIDILKKLFSSTEQFKLLVPAMNSLSTRQFVELMAQSNFSSFGEEEFDPFNKDMTSQKMLKENDILNNMSMEIAMNYKMNDGSMAPLIPEGSKLTLEKTSELKNGDIVLVEDENNKLFVRFYTKVGNTISLIPMNRNFDTFEFDEEKMLLRAIVSGYIVTL